jgi:hypothetical protein
MNVVLCGGGEKSWRWVAAGALVISNDGKREELVKFAKFACQYEFEAYRIVVGRKWIPRRQTKLVFRS